MNMKDRLIQLKKTFDALYWGADMRLLRKCLDERTRFIRYEILIVVLSGITIYVTEDITRGYGLAAGLVVFFLYKWFLSNLNLVIEGETYSFLKWLISTILALALTYVFCYYDLNIFFNSLDLLDIVGVFIVLSITLFLCYAPVRFTSAKETLYAKLVDLERKQERLQAELQVSSEGAKIDYAKLVDLERKQERLQAELQVSSEGAKIEIQKRAQKEYIASLSQEIASTRLRVAKVALDKWEKEQIKKVETNLDEYIKS